MGLCESWKIFSVLYSVSTGFPDKKFKQTNLITFWKEWPTMQLKTRGLLTSCRTYFKYASGFHVC